MREELARRRNPYGPLASVKVSERVFESSRCEREGARAGLQVVTALFGPRPLGWARGRGANHPFEVLIAFSAHASLFCH
jgi:hypothetical protein